MSEKLIGSCIFGQSGGPTSVINASAYGVIRTALDAEEITEVYGAENGVVYHTEINCTYIRLSISPTSLDQVKNLRNEYGGKYHPCEKCGRHASGVVFITKDGDRYHSSLECSGLKRTISQVSMEEAGHLRPCPRCSGKHSGSHS